MVNVKNWVIRDSDYYGGDINLELGPLMSLTWKAFEGGSVTLELTSGEAQRLATALFEAADAIESFVTDDQHRNDERASALLDPFLPAPETTEEDS